MPACAGCGGDPATACAPSAESGVGHGAWRRGTQLRRVAGGALGGRGSPRERVSTLRPEGRFDQTRGRGMGEGSGAGSASRGTSVGTGRC